MFGIAFSFLACKQEKDYIYEMRDVKATQNVSNKQTQKNDREFISLAYSDLYGTTINQTELTNLLQMYDSFGDKVTFVDMLIRNFLSDTTVKLPTKSYMQSNTEQFVADAFQKLLIRKPNEYERKMMADIIQQDTTITPRAFYYAIMTSQEYRFY